MPPPSRRARTTTRQRPRSLADLRYVAGVTAAYNAAAATYDADVRELQWMREALWRHYRRLFRAHDRVLDVGCGTGLDALWLADRGVRVTGLDLSSRMLEELTAQAARRGLDDFVRVQVGETAELATWPGGYFHGVVSAFGTLNTVPDLAGFAADAARLLLPGGRLVIHVLAPGIVGERGEEREARAHRHRTRLVAGHPVSHRMITAREAHRRYFRKHFRLRRRYGLGFLLPEARMAKMPFRLARAVGRIETVLGRLPLLLERGRYFVLDLEPRTGP